MNGTPWWYSGDEQSGPEPEEPNTSSSGPRLGTDWGALLSGAQRVVDWATETVMAPHAEHDDPREHPQCVICRTIALLGDQQAAGAAPSEPEEQSPPTASAPTIQWIPIRSDPAKS